MSDTLLQLAARNARDEFRPVYRPHAWAGIEGNRDLARMSRVAILEVPALTARFEADLEPFIQRIHAIDKPRLRLVQGGRA